ncbi:hypothetical protein WFJ11_02510 [Parvimonas micra]|uniref:hypothetical protein n=1 Tax=Parvimonas micra TaxID=33033 RepID=UPI0030CE8AED
MNKKFQKAIALGIVFSMIIVNISFAEEKNTIKKSETVYVTIDGNEVKDKTVSVWLNSDKNINVKDKSDLKEVKNLKNDKTVTEENGYLNWNESEKDIYYQGKTDKNLPVELTVKYYLDDKEVSNSELDGKSGHLKIVLSSKNNRHETKSVNGKTQEVYSPYIVATAMVFDDEKVSDIKSDDVKIIKDGKNQIVTSILTPGLKQNFDSINKDKDLKIFKDSISLEMDIKDYKPIEIYSVITNEFFQENKNLDSIDNLKDGIQQLEDNSQKLFDASVKLSEGQEKLNNGIGQLQGGVKQIYSGTEKLYSSMEKIKGKFDSLAPKVGVIQNYISEMYNGSLQLSNGVNNYTGAVSKITENVEKIQNGATLIDKGSNDLDNGVEKLKNATGKMKEGSKKIDNLISQKDELLNKSTQLSQGMSNLGASYGKIVSAIEEMSKKSIQLKNSTKEFNTKIHQVENSTKSLNSNISLENDIKNLEAKANNIQKVIDDLSNKNKDGSLTSEISILNKTKNDLLNESKTLKAKQTGLSKINTLAQAMSELASNSDKLLKANSDLSDGLLTVYTKMNESKVQLEKSTTDLNAGLSKIGESMKADDLKVLKSSIEQLDGATGKIKTGTESLKSATNQNKVAMGMLQSAMSKLDENSNSLKNGSGQLANGLGEFKTQSQILNSLSQVKEQAIIPFSNAINSLNEGLKKMDSSTDQLKEGSDKLTSSQKEFSSKLGEFKQKGIDELENKTKEVNEFKDILDIMLSMSKQDASFSGTDDNFDTKSRIIEKIK